MLYPIYCDCGKENGISHIEGMKVRCSECMFEHSRRLSEESAAKELKWKMDLGLVKEGQ